MGIKQQAKEDGKQAKDVKSPRDTLLVLVPDTLDLVVLKIWVEGDVFLGLGKQTVTL
jgi:hypothetical protein